MVFINTGFLDRTGDEIHTSMEAGAMVRKAAMKAEKWIAAYENWKRRPRPELRPVRSRPDRQGHWAMPDLMAGHAREDLPSPDARATPPGFPRPAASLHALHYHKVNVFERQKAGQALPFASVDDILAIPLARDTNWSAEEIQNEIDNNVQGILGYVVRWIDQGVGAPGAGHQRHGLMEDRATLRISRRADGQLAAPRHHHRGPGDREHEAHGAGGGPAERGRCRLQADGPGLRQQHRLPGLAGADRRRAKQPNGYTDRSLHRRRREFKAKNGL